MKLALIDGSNLYESARSLRMEIDYKKLMDVLQEDNDLLRAYYFTALRSKEIESQIRKTVDWVSHHGYIPVLKETKEWKDDTGRLKIKGNVDVDIATYAFIHATLVQHIYLFSGDGDFTIMVKELQARYALKVHVVSTIGLVSTELRKQADSFIDLSSLRNDIEMIRR